MISIPSSKVLSVCNEKMLPATAYALLGYPSPCAAKADVRKH